MRARTLAFLPIMSLVLASCAGIGGTIEDTSAGVRGFVSSTGDKISGLFDREDEAKALKAAAILSDQPEADPATVRTIQRLLADAGYRPGAADGIYGPKTRAAIIAYQRTMELTPDGLITGELVASLQESGKSTVALLEKEDAFFDLASGL